MTILPRSTLRMKATGISIEPADASCLSGSGEDVEDYKTFEPWLEAHPEVPGLTKVVGHGPFILDQYKVGEYVRLKKNPIYWRLPK